MIIKLLKAAAIFLLAVQKPQEILAKMTKESTDTIDNSYFPLEIKTKLAFLNSEIDKYSNKLPILVNERAYGLSDAHNFYNDYYQDIQNQYRFNRLDMLNTVKRLALGLDACFKANNQLQVKYHQVASAVYQALYDLFEAEDLDALRSIFGDVIDDEHTFHVMRSMIIDIVEEARAASSDSLLNNALNNWRSVDQKGRFQSYTVNEPKVSEFRGQLVITHSYQKKNNLESGDVVNVVLTINAKDTAELVRIVMPQLKELGLEVGRLTGTTDKEERHVSLGLRLPYSEKLGETVKHINEHILPSLTFKTAARLRVVTPMDIRSSSSAISLLDAESVQQLEQLQQDIIRASASTGNQLPQLHITHGNSPIKMASLFEVEKLRRFAPKLDDYLRMYQLELPTDKDNPGSEKVGQFSLENPDASLQCHTMPHGMGGIAPVRYSFFDQCSEKQEQVNASIPNYSVNGAPQCRC